MADLVCMRVADMDIEVHALHPGLRRFCTGYLADGFAGAPDLVLTITQEDIDYERSRSEPGTNWSDGYLETLAVLRALGAWMPSRDRALMHGAVLEYGGRAYMFTAASGTGKSTHLRLWRQELGAAVQVVNGDKPFLHIPPTDEDPIRAYGTPWCGKEGWQRNVARPLSGICFLSRAEPGASHACPLDPADAIERALLQLYVPLSEDGTGKTLEMLDQLLRRVPLFDLAVDMSADAVRASFEALTGESFERARVQPSGEV